MKRRIHPAVWWGAGIVGVFFFVVCPIVSYLALGKLTFTEERILHDGKSHKIVAQEIRDELLKRPNMKQFTFKNQDGQLLTGFHLKRENAKATMLLCHGYRGSKEFMYTFLELFPEWNMISFDFRAHGQSEGSITTIGCHEYKDVLAAVDYVKQEAKQSGKELPLIVLGVSMGGAAALKAAESSSNMCNVLVIDSTYASLNATVMKGFARMSGLPLYPFFTMTRMMFHFFAQCDLHEMEMTRSVKKIKQPMLFIHSCVDSMISPSSALKLWASSDQEKCKLWVGPSCRHGCLSMYKGDLYKKKVTKFVTRALNSR
ncbi:MAG: alpha/beta fold hydrolase [Epsilonproteobacteria bacterium]|nr:alpha/beta fold hydrolase [Campylobacterota bacterium]